MCWGDKMSYRLLACDIDNTLVRFPHPPSAPVQRAIRAAVDAGVVVVLSTGRAFRRARPVAEMLGLDTPMICNHGGSIRATKTGDLLYRKVLPPALAREAVSWLQTQHVHMFCFDGDLVYHDGRTDQVVPDFQVYTQGEQSFWTPDILTALPAQVEVILSTSPDHDHLARVHTRTVTRFGAQARILFSHPFGMDFMPPSSKSEALAWLAGQLGISQAEVMAVGDGGNDADMLAWAGLGIAMGDGEAEALAAADQIAPPFTEDGLAWAIEYGLSMD